jgi:hypothetical protein
MATLGSPGVQVQVIDESFYTPAAPGTIPLIFVATAQDKSNASLTGTAQGTTAANVGKVYVITSQRDLTDTFGTPLFYTDASGNPIHGDELHEYGLQAAYSVLGVSSRAYIARADVNLAQLEPSTSIPTGSPVSGTYWVDTANTLFGINEWDSPTGKFTVKTPLVVDNTNMATDSATGTPLDSFGQQGDYAVYVTSDNGQTYANTLFYKTTAGAGAWVVVDANFDGGKTVAIAPHTSYPDFTTSTGIAADTGSVWIKTTVPGKGSNWIVKYYNGTTAAWTTVSAPVYLSTREALEKLDFAGGGLNIAVGSVFVEVDPEHVGTADFRVWRRVASGATQIVSNASSYTTSTNAEFQIRETLDNGSAWSGTATITVAASLANPIGAQIPAAISAMGLLNVTATYDAITKKVTIKHALGGDIELVDTAGDPLANAGFSAYNMTTKTGTANLYTAPSGDVGAYDFIASNWKPLVYEAKASAPVTLPTDGRLWFDNSVSEVDILVHNGTKWVGLQDAASPFVGVTDPAGPIISATEPMDGDRSDSGNLATGDIWINTSDTEMYGKEIYVYDSTLAVGRKWVQQDVTDQSSPTGWLFADARWGNAGTDAMTSKPSIADLIVSDYVDPDAPDPALYPKGMKLWNTRRSGNNVKKYISGHINLTANEGVNIRYPSDTDMSGYVSDRWVSQQSVNEDGSGKFGRMAQRGVVVAAFKELIDTNAAIRDTDTLTYNLIATPGYPEAIQNMVAFNNDIGQLSFIVGDTPFRLAPNATALTAWGKNTGNAFDNGDDGAVTYDEYMGLFYPSGYTNDNTGNKIVVPPSHMMLRTIINSDAKSYQWFAPAGTRRGGVDNATSVGYIGAEGEFKTVSLYEGLRDVLQEVGTQINPIATLPGVGVVNFGQKTRAKNSSALDRINVVRLIAFLRRQLTVLAKPFLFEPNDAQTRREMKAAVESLLLELVGQRALYDFVVVCDNSNNTPARIDRSELYVDIAIEPVKAVEFIYIPLRIKNTGDIQAGL